MLSRAKKDYMYVMLSKSGVVQLEWSTWWSQFFETVYVSLYI